MSQLQEGKVKSVLSGDTLILTPKQNPKLERTLSLAFVSAPRLKRDGDESYAFESRDLLRLRTVGQVVQFRVLYTIPTGAKREYALVTLIDGTQLPELAVAEGLLKLREDAGKREEGEEMAAMVEKLRVLETRAKADGKGMWQLDAAPVRTQYELSDPQAFVQRWKGQALKAVVEKVLTGDRLIVRFMESDTQHTQTMLLIAGIRAPNTKRVNATGGQEQPAEPLGEEAHEYLEHRLLQRSVFINVLGVSPQNQIVGAVKHRVAGDVAANVLKDGFARCVDHHSTMLGAEMAPLRQAEKAARDERRGIFKGTAAPARAPGSNQGEAVVSRVQTADTLYIRLPNGSEKRVSLTSIRQPKPSDPKQSPFGADAKEYLRKRLIGKHVRVATDGKRPATEGYDEREMVTVTQNGKNVALAVVEAGYASVTRHRMDDTDRSPIYDDLLAAEATAQAEERGMWSSKAPEAKAYVDYSENLEKAKRLFTLLARQKRVPAIVDFVKGGSRFTLLIPRENAKITLVLSGIQAPKQARNQNETSDPFGQEAYDLAVKRCQQRDVEIDVEDNDKVGGFIGRLYINRENFAKILLEEGYATVRTYSAEKSGNASELLAAEKKAKDERKGMWHDYDPSTELEADAAPGAEDDSQANGTATMNGDSEVASAPPSKDYRDVMVTHVTDECRLKIQLISPATTGALTSLMNAFRSFHISPQNSASLKEAPKAGEIVAARFSEDKEWYRARVRRNDRDAKTSEVLYIDYGNSETRPWSELRPLGKSEFSLQTLKTQAIDAALSFVQFPSGSPEYMRDAQGFMMQRLCGGQLVARVDHTDARDGTLWVTLFDPKSEAGSTSVEGASMNAEIVEEGMAMVGRKLSRWERAQVAALKGLTDKESEAKAERRGMWEYGDLTDD